VGNGPPASALFSICRTEASGFASLPEGVSFGQIFGIAMLAGVGFTMSMFIANLAFADTPVLMDSAKIGIMTGSLVSSIGGFIMLRFFRKNNGEGITS